MLGHGMLDVDRTVVHGLAKPMHVRSETLGHLQQITVMAVAQEDEVKLPVDGVVLAHRRPVELGPVGAPPSCVPGTAAPRCWLGHRLELGQHLGSRGHRAPDGRDLDDGAGVDQLSRPLRGERG